MTSEKKTWAKEFNWFQQPLRARWKTELRFIKIFFKIITYFKGQMFHSSDTLQKSRWVAVTILC